MEKVGFETLTLRVDGKIVSFEQAKQLAEELAATLIINPIDTAQWNASDKKCTETGQATKTHPNPFNNSNTNEIVQNDTDKPSQHSFMYAKNPSRP